MHSSPAPHAPARTGAERSSRVRAAPALRLWWHRCGSRRRGCLARGRFAQKKCVQRKPAQRHPFRWRIARTLRPVQHAAQPGNHQNQPYPFGFPRSRGVVQGQRRPARANRHGCPPARPHPLREQPERAHPSAVRSLLHHQRGCWGECQLPGARQRQRLPATPPAHLRRGSRQCSHAENLRAPAG